MGLTIFWGVFYVFNHLQIWNFKIYQISEQTLYNGGESSIIHSSHLLLLSLCFYPTLHPPSKTCSWLLWVISERFRVSHGHIKMVSRPCPRKNPNHFLKAWSRDVLESKVEHGCSVFNENIYLKFTYSLNTYYTKIVFLQTNNT